MIKREYYTTRKDGVMLYRTYSDDKTKYIKQVETGRVYKDAIDVYPIKYTYVETDEPQQPQIKLTSLFKNRKVLENDTN